MRPSKIKVTTIARSVEKILAVKQMLNPPTTLVPKFAGNQQVSNHVCPDIGVSIIQFCMKSRVIYYFPLKKN